jgi:HPt (histidine-containing phosphotransfer) domain-containing protein
LRERLAGLSRRFLERAADDRQHIAAALQRGNLTEVAALAHRLAGTAGSFGFGDLGQQAVRFEELIKQGAAPEEFDAAADQLLSSIDRAVAAAA